MLQFCVLRPALSVVFFWSEPLLSHVLQLCALMVPSYHWLCFSASEPLCMAMLP